MLLLFAALFTLRRGACQLRGCSTDGVEMYTCALSGKGLCGDALVRCVLDGAILKSAVMNSAAAGRAMMSRAVRHRAGALGGLFTMLVIGALAGCGGSQNYNQNSTTNKPITTAFLRVVNTLPDSPTLLAGLDGQTLTKVSFAQGTALQQLTSGKYAIDAQYLNTAGTAVAVIDKEKVDLAVDEQATVFIVGTLSAPHTHLIDNTKSTIAAGSAEVQVMNSVASQPNVDVYLTDAAADLATAAKLTTVAFDESSPLTTIPSGDTYRLRVTAAGSTAVLYDSGVFPIASTARLIFAVVDYFGPGGSGFRVVQLDNQQSTQFPNEALPGAFRVANMIADVPSVDVYVGGITGTPAFAGVAFGTVAALQDFGAGNLDYAMTAAGDAATVLASGTVVLSPGETRTLVAARSGGVATRVTLDTTRPVSGRGQLQIINAAPTAGPLDTYLIADGHTIETTVASAVNQPLLAIAGAVEAPGSYDVTATATATTTPIAGPTPLVIDDGGIYSIYAVDAAGGGGPYQIVFSPQ